MSPVPPTRRLGASHAPPFRNWLPAMLFCGLLALLAAPPATAQERFIKPWVPPDTDSLVSWTTEARARFRSNQGDSITGENFRAYQIVANAGRRLIKSLGKENFAQAHAVEAVFDSLGLDTEITFDPSNPEFVLMMVRNPFRLTANAAGYLYWYRGKDLRIQGALFEGGLSPHMKVWWTGQPEAPYSLAIVDRSRAGLMRLLFVRLSADGTYFNLVQYGNSSPVLGGPGEATFSDVNGDGRPEIVAWVRLEPDSSFQPCRSCPPLISERTYTEHHEGFELHDVRLLPSAFATFTQFIRLLSQGERTGARRLLEHPEKLEEAIGYGWAHRGVGLWSVEEAQEDEPWARWFDMRFKGAKGTQHVRVRFALKEGRWVIERWEPTPGHGRSGMTSGTKG